MFIFTTVHDCPHPSPRRGFTFLEMSIVLVVISLLIGGVMVGGDMLRSARLRTIVTDTERYESAVTEFQKIYRALPGDMANATDFWGEADPDPDTCSKLAGDADASTDKTTCDGDGNDSIYGSNAASYRGHEMFRMWQHLANAELIDGQYAGVNHCDVDFNKCFKAGWNSPTSEIRTATWALFDLSGGTTNLPQYFYAPTTAADPNATPSDESGYRHVIIFGGEEPDSTFPFERILTPKELWSIDTKFDDGKPSSGSIRTIEPVSGGSWNNDNDCATTNSTATAEYKLTNEGLECVIVFLLDY